MRLQSKAKVVLCSSSKRIMETLPFLLVAVLSLCLMPSGKFIPKCLNFPDENDMQYDQRKALDRLSYLPHGSFSVGALLRYFHRL